MVARSTVYFPQGASCVSLHPHDSRPIPGPFDQRINHPQQKKSPRVQQHLASPLASPQNHLDSRTQTFDIIIRAGWGRRSDPAFAFPSTDSSGVPFLLLNKADRRRLRPRWLGHIPPLKHPDTITLHSTPWRHTSTATHPTCKTGATATPRRGPSHGGETRAAHGRVTGRLAQ